MHYSTSFLRLYVKLYDVAITNIWIPRWKRYTFETCNESERFRDTTINKIDVTADKKTTNKRFISFANLFFNNFDDLTATFWSLWSMKKFVVVSRTHTYQLCNDRSVIETAGTPIGVVEGYYWFWFRPQIFIHKKNIERNISSSV